MPRSQPGPGTRSLARPPVGRGARRPAPDATVRPLPLSALIAGLLVGLGGLLVAVALTVGAWLLAGAPGAAGGPVRAGALGWLLAYGAPLSVGGVHWTLLPLGLTLAAAWALVRAARWTAGSRAAEPTELALGAVTLWCTHVVLAVGVAVLASRPGAEADLPGLLARTGLLAAAAVAVGTVQGADLPWRRLLPTPVVVVAEAAAVTVLGVLLVAVLVLAGALALHADEAATVMGSLDLPGPAAAAFGLALLATLPNAVLCAVSYLAGPGFALGVGTTVTATRVDVGAVPAYPLLAAVPDGPLPSWATVLLLAAPLLVAAASGVALARRHRFDDVLRAALLGAAGGAAAAVVLAGLCALAAGSAGSGRLAEIGPAGLAVVLALLPPLVGGGAVGAAGTVLAVRRWETAPGGEPAPEPAGSTGSGDTA